MNRKFTVEDIEKLLHTKTTNNALVSLTHRINDAMVLFHYATRSSSNVVRIEASKHCVVSFISGIEVFCKELILEYKDKWVDEGYSKLLTEKISLNEAYGLFKHLEVKREVIVTHYNSFQSIENINRVFSALTGTDFLLKVENTLVYDAPEKFSLVQVFQEWRKDLIELFKLRHNIIHENNIDLVVDETTIIFLSGFVYSICLAMVRYCNENLFKEEVM